MFACVGAFTSACVHVCVCVLTDSGRNKRSALCIGRFSANQGLQIYMYTSMKEHIS